MAIIPWQMHATLYSGGNIYATGSLARLAQIYLREEAADRRWSFFISGKSLPVLHGDDRPGMMLGGGLEELGAAFQREQPPIEEPRETLRDKIAHAFRLRPADVMPFRQRTPR